MLMPNEKKEMSALSPTNQIDYRKYRGVRQTQSGKWGAAILHPVTKVSVWLGSYNTPKEAADAFVKKKMEYQSLAAHKSQDFVNTKLGANIQDPGCDGSVCLESCNSAEDYARKMPEFDYARNSPQVLMSDEYLEVSAPSRSNQTDYRKHRGVRLTKSGKWGAVIRHPITKISVWLGSYNTPREAADAFMRRKIEYQSLVVHKTPDTSIQGAKIQGPVTNATVGEEPGEVLDNMTCEAKFMDQAEMKNCNKSKDHVIEDVIALRSKTTNPLFVDLAEADGYSGTSSRKETGIWGAQISYGNSKVHVGMCSTFEELEAAIHKKRAELESSVEAAAKEPLNEQFMRNQYPQKQVNIIRPYGEEHMAQVVSNNALDLVADVQEVTQEDRTTTITTTTSNKESVEALMRKRRESALLINAEKKRKQSIYVDEIALPKKTDCSLNVNDFKAPCSMVVSNDEFDREGIINAYGQLVGEFSVMDDDLWLAESLNGVDEI